MNISSAKKTSLNVLKMVVTIMLLTSIASVSNAEEYYKWQEAGGTWKYGSHPPKGVGAIVVSTTAAGNRESSTENDTLDESVPKPQLSDEDAERNRQYCETANKNLEALQSDAVIQRRDENGKVVKMSGDDKKLAMDNAKLAIDRYCEKR